MSDQSKKIRVSSVKRNDYGLSVGEKTQSGWTNYYCNDESVCQVLEGAKGGYAFVTYHQNPKGNNIIVSATVDSPQQTVSGGNAGSGGHGDNKDYNMQNCVKAAAQVLTGQAQDISGPAREIGVFIGEVAKGIYETCYAQKPLEDMVKKAQEALDATPVDEDEDDGIPF